MKNLRGWWVMIGLMGNAMAVESMEEIKWPDAMQVLKSVAAEPMPAKPVEWQSPDGPFVLHGDLFGDGRHLALVGNQKTTLAQGTKSGWKILSIGEVAPAWVPAGMDRTSWGFSHISPPAQPFALKDLNGDHVPEILIAFDNDGCSVGYRIGMKSDQGLKLLDLRSESGEPEVMGDFTTVTSETSGRKAWWSGTTYYKWADGLPFPVATWIEDSSRDLEGPRFIALRQAKGKVSEAFEMVKDDGAWTVLSCTWNRGVTTSDQKPFAKVRFKKDPTGSADDHQFLAEMVLMFELTTGIKGTASILPKGNQKGFDLKKATAGLQIEIEGSEEARKLLKRVP